MSRKSVEPSDLFVPGKCPWEANGDGEMVRKCPPLRRPRYTSCPDDFYDHIAPFLTGAELKVMLYIIRRTFGFQQDQASISLNQLAGGLEMYNGGANLHRRTVCKVLNSLEEKGLIVRQRRRNREGEPIETVYALNLKD